jgi:hypothetical protein
MYRDYTAACNRIASKVISYSCATQIEVKWSTAIFQPKVSSIHDIILSVRKWLSNLSTRFTKPTHYWGCGFESWNCMKNCVKFHLCQRFFSLPHSSRCEDFQWASLQSYKQGLTILSSDSQDWMRWWKYSEKKLLRNLTLHDFKYSVDFWRKRNLCGHLELISHSILSIWNYWKCWGEIQLKSSKF